MFEILQLHHKDIGIMPVQWHALCMGLFASIIAPFGGSFASGFKRTLKIKVRLIDVLFFLRSYVLDRVSGSDGLKILKGSSS